MRSKIFCMVSIMVLMLFANKSYANGGPMGSEGIIAGGNIKFEDQKNIELIYEKLDIDLDIDVAKISVMYKLKNNGDAVDCDYMFPVDAYISEFNSIPDVNQVVSNFRMYDNGKYLEYIAKNPIKIENTKYEKICGETYKYNHISKLHFNKDEEKTLIVKYEIKPGYLDWSTSKRFLPSYGDKIVLYDLSPARHWGSGKIGLIEININYDKIIDKKPKFDINPYNFKKEKKGIFTYKKEDFEIGEKEILDISYDLDNFYYTIFCEKSKMRLNEFKKISVSSTLKESGYSYEKELMLDQNLDTCWSEGATGLGKNEWIEFEFKEPIEIGLIGIINGFTKNENTFNNNGKIKEMKVDIEFYDPVNGFKTESRIQSFEKHAYEELNKMFYGKFFDTVVNLGEAYRKVSKVKLTILDVYEGEKYNDTCISEIYFLKPVTAENNYKYPPLVGKYSIYNPPNENIKENVEENIEFDTTKIAYSVDSQTPIISDKVFIKRGQTLVIYMVGIKDGIYYCNSEKIIEDGKTYNTSPFKNYISDNFYEIKPQFLGYDNAPYTIQPIKYELKLVDITSNSFDFFGKFDEDKYGTYYLKVKNKEDKFDKKEIIETNDILNEFETNSLLQVIYRRDDSYLGYLTELFNTPFILSPSYINGYHQTDKRVGSDCAAFAIYGKRRQGYDVFYGGPRGIYNYLKPISKSVIYLDIESEKGIYKDVNKKPISTITALKSGDIIHFKEQVSVFYKDEGIIGLLDKNDLLIQSYGKTPYITTLKNNGFYKKPFRIFRWNIHDNAQKIRFHKQ